jgi:hypothetical protein
MANGGGCPARALSWTAGLLLAACAASAAPQAGFGDGLEALSVRPRKPQWSVSTSHTEVDTDGDIRDRALRALVVKQDRGWSRRKRRYVDYHSDDTALHTGDGRALDPTAVRYVVVTRASGIPLGARVVVSDPATGSAFDAVVGDRGPRLGEVSLKLARDIDPRAAPNNGISRRLVYTFFPGVRVRAADEGSLLAALAGESLIPEVRPGSGSPSEEAAAR